MTVCRRFRLTEDEAEDIAQDVLLKLWTLRDDLDRVRSVEALAAGMARNLCLDLLRRRRPASSVEDLSLADECTPAPDDRLTAMDNEAWLLRRLATLPTKEYEVLRLRQVEHRTTAEIAAIAGIAESSVPTLLSRARRKLLQSFQHRDTPPKLKI